MRHPYPPATRTTPCRKRPLVPIRRNNPTKKMGTGRGLISTHERSALLPQSVTLGDSRHETQTSFGLGRRRPGCPVRLAAGLCPILGFVSPDNGNGRRQRALYALC